MSRMWLLLLGATATMTFALVVLVVVPNAMLESIPAPPELRAYSQAEAEGRALYVSLGCIYCHTQQVRDPNFTTDADRGWGRPSVPSDYVYDFPHQLGTMRTGPDLINVGARLPDRQWHLLHLYQPRIVAPWSLMPSFPFLFGWKPAGEAQGEIVRLPPGSGREGQVLIASPEAQHLVDYLLSLNRTYPPSLPEAGQEAAP